MGQCESGSQTLGELLHILANFLVHNPGVVLGAGDVLVSEHFADGFNGHAVHHGHRGGKGVSRDMKGQGFGDSAEVSKLFEVGVDFLVTRHG